MGKLNNKARVRTFIVFASACFGFRLLVLSYRTSSVCVYIVIRLLALSIRSEAGLDGIWKDFCFFTWF